VILLARCVESRISTSLEVSLWCLTSLRMTWTTTLSTDWSFSSSDLTSSAASYACHQIIDTRVTGYRLVVEDCNCASVGTGYQQEPPAISAAEKAGFSEVVTAGVAGRILNPRSQGRELKDRCDYSSQIYREGTFGAFFTFMTVVVCSTAAFIA